MQSQTLPSHRQLFTALINSASPPKTGSSTTTTTTTSLLLSDAAASPDRRHLLLTLHVIFPSLLLPALDLLDRGLVSRLITSSPRSSENGESPTANAGIETPVHIVQSVASSTSSRRRRDTAQPSRRYVVHLRAWSCSCARFALDAYPSLAETGLNGQDDDDPALSWSFGGLSLDGQPRGWENVPCCKHLLACVLAERWGSVLGSEVDHRRATKEELAAIIASL